MTREEIIYKVRVLLEEVSPFDEPSDGFFAAGGETPSNPIKPIHTYIDNVLEESKIEVLRSLPLQLLKSAVKSDMLYEPGNGINVDVYGICRFDVPADFIRLASIQAKGWERSVIVSIGTENPIYTLQQNKYTRGGSAKPVVAICPVNETYNTHFELYTIPVNSGVTFNSDYEKIYEVLEQFNYVYDCTITTLSDEVVEYVCLIAAGRVADIFNQTDIAKTFRETISNRLKTIQI